MSEFPSYEDYLNKKKPESIVESVDEGGVITFEDYLKNKKPIEPEIIEENFPEELITYEDYLIKKSPSGVFKIKKGKTKKISSEDLITFEDYLVAKNVDELERTLYELEYGDDPNSITFEEFKSRRNEDSFEGFNLLNDESAIDDFGPGLGLITFEDYQRIKGGSSSLEIFKDVFITEDDEKLFTKIKGLVSFEEYLEVKRTGNVEKIEELKERGISEHIINAIKTKKYNSYVDIQSDKYLDESRTLYNKALEEERKRIHNIYPQIGDFFGVGAPVILERNPEGDCAVIGRAIIGKNIICG
jgi:hypothetical protein